MSQDPKREKTNENIVNNRQNQNTIPNANDNLNADPNPDTQQEQPGFFSRFKNIIYVFIAFQIISALFGSKMKNQILFQNIFSDDTVLNVNFYIAQSKFPLDYETISKKLNPIWSIDQIKYSSQGNDTNLEREIEYVLDLKNENEKNLNTEGLYLYAAINLSDKKSSKNLRRQFKKDFDNMDILFDSINLLKYTENLQDSIRSLDLMNDLENSNFKESTASNEGVSDQLSGTETNRSNRTTKISNLYYKPEIYFYLTSVEKTQDISVFQEMNTMGIKPTIFKTEKKFVPYTYLTDFWTMLSDLKQVEKYTENSESDTAQSNSTIKFKINFKFLGMFYFKFLRGIEMNSEMMEKNFHVPASKDMFVELLKNNSSIYLTIMLVVNVLHSLFSILGFASDISYYKNLKKLDGLYTKHLFFHLFHLAITFLYVYMEGANIIVKVELGIALAIEVWKFRKIFKFEINQSKFPYVQISYKISFDKTQSKNYETEAVSLMMKYIFVPVAVLYLSYRIFYYKNLLFLSIFKFVIEYIFFLMNLFGFILLTPQIYLNYKLKSVKHLPLKALTFKFLNTIIDDLYAFAVKTPTLYRVFCFKDDLIFVIYILQIVIYRKNKRNELEDEEEEGSKIELENLALKEDQKNLEKVIDKDESDRIEENKKIEMEMKEEETRVEGVKEKFKKN